MKILLSAYACEPNRGSEPSVGWNWALSLSKIGHQVWVLTRSNNKSPIEKELTKTTKLNNLHFIYYDLPLSIRHWKKRTQWVYLYYLLWQWGAYNTVKHLAKNIPFDFVHHVTFASARQPSFMGNLGIPFIFGPVAGGEHAPWCLRFHYGISGFLIDLMRDFANFIVKFDPLMLQTLSKAQKIYVTSEHTKKMLPCQFHRKVEIQLAIGFSVDEKEEPTVFETKDNVSKILYVGRFLYWKGMGLGIRAFALFAKKNPDALLTMVGQGNEENKWRYLSKKLNIEERIKWIQWVDRKHLEKIYQLNDVLLFPSLHDSGGMVILEALSMGKPVVCLDIGGPSTIIDDSCGIKIDVKKKTESQIVAALSSALVRLTEDENYYLKLKQGALRKISTFDWRDKFEAVYGDQIDQS